MGRQEAGVYLEKSALKSQAAVGDGAGGRNQAQKVVSDAGYDWIVTPERIRERIYSFADLIARSNTLRT
jgi:hypothetical protein